LEEAMEKNLGKLIRTLGNSLQKMRNEVSLHHGLTASQTSVMIFLLKNQQREEINLLDIQNEFSLTHQTVNGLVNRLVSKGFLATTTSRRDKRYLQIGLTPKALGMWEDLEALFHRVESRLMNGMSPSEQQEFIRLLELAISNVQTPMTDQENRNGR
jgi:MarR family multiple gene transcriptional regulator MgrA